jgi:preprotein translocase subunit SecD
MKIRWQRFNLYLLAAVAAVAVWGCQSTSSETKPKKLLSMIRLHLETSQGGNKDSELVPVYRQQPVWLNVSKIPFLTEAEVADAKVVDVMGGFAIRIQFDGPGTALFEACTTANRGKRIAVFSQFGEQIKDSRWLAAPIISHRITDGVFTFTPDTTREETEEIAAGLRNVAKQVQ